MEIIPVKTYVAMEIEFKIDLIVWKLSWIWAKLAKIQSLK